MSQLVELELEDGGSILVEVDERVGGPVTRGRAPGEVTRRRGTGEAIEEAGKRFDEVLAHLGPAVSALASQVRAVAERPDELELEFAVKLTANANVIIARTGGEANFRVAVRWKSAE